MQCQQLLEAGTQTEPPKSDEQLAPARPASAAAPADQECRRLGTPPVAAGPKPQTPRPATASVCGNGNSSSNIRLPTPAAPASQSRPATARAATPAADSRKLLPARPKTSLQVQSTTTKRQPQQQQLSDRTPMALSHNPDPRLRSWQRLEHLRLHSMGLSSKLSRRYNVARVFDFEPVGSRFPEPAQQPPGVWLPTLMSPHHPQQPQPQPIFYTASARKKNDVAPFRTFQKPTCGVFFTRETDNKKAKHDLEPTDLIKWRYFL